MPMGPIDDHIPSQEAQQQSFQNIADRIHAPAG